MVNISRSLIYEIARYEPLILLTLEWVSQALCQKISADLDYVYTLLEEVYGLEKVRDHNWKDCKPFLRTNTTVLLYKHPNKVICYDVRSTKQAVYSLDLPVNLNGAGWVILSRDVLFICGINYLHPNYARCSWNFTFSSSQLS